MNGGRSMGKIRLSDIFKREIENAGSGRDGRPAPFDDLSERKIPNAVLKWRKKQGKGHIMTSSKFNAIVKRLTPTYGEEIAKKIAGRIYWNRVLSLYKKAVKKYRER